MNTLKNVETFTMIKRRVGSYSFDSISLHFFPFSYIRLDLRLGLLILYGIEVKYITYYDYYYFPLQKIRYNSMLNMVHLFFKSDQRNIEADKSLSV